MSRYINNQRSKEKGTVALEMALAFPWLLLTFMIMLFLVDLMMIKQEITTSGFSAMRTCVAHPNKEACVLAVVTNNQIVGGSRYSCTTNAGVAAAGAGVNVPVVNLNCTYEGFMPAFRTIADVIGVDMSDMVNIEIPVFFPEI